MKTLLIAGGGTLGLYTAEELLRLGSEVEVIALEELTSDNPKLTFIRERVDDAYLTGFLAGKHYDAIVDFIHYPDPAAYEKRLPLLQKSTDHLVFLSSYRVYADREHPVKYSSPQLLDACAGDEFLLKNDNYGISKCYEERILRRCENRNWTIVRPLISFSHFRFDLITQGAGTLLTRPKEGKPILLPEEARKLTAGLTWAGNTGKIIARLALNGRAKGEDYVLGTGEKHTWEEVAGYYTELNGARFVWVDTETYLRYATSNDAGSRIILCYDRLFDREVDAEKTLLAAGLGTADFLPVRQALEKEMENAKTCKDPRLADSLRSAHIAAINRKMDEYLGIA